MSHNPSVLCVFRSVSSLIRARSSSFRILSHCQSLRLSRPYLQTNRCLTSAPLSYNNNVYWTLHELISQGNYSDAITLWEEEKASGQAEDPSIYMAAMSLCEKIGSGMAAKAVKENIERRGWTVDAKCALHYINALLGDGMREEAVTFVHAHYSTIEDDEEFLVEAAMSFHLRGYSSDACSICQIESAQNSPQLLALQLEILGSLKQLTEMWDIIDQKYGGDLASAHPLVQVGMVHGLALADECQKAVTLLESLINKKSFDVSSNVTVRSVALLLESAKRTEDCNAGAFVCHNLWKTVCSIKSALVAPHTYTYLLRAINAGVHLQALVLKQHRPSRLETHKLRKFNILKDISGTRTDKLSLEKELRTKKGLFIEEESKPLMSQDFFRILTDNSLIPDRHTYEALLLLSCFSDTAMVMADQVLRLSLQSSGVEYSPSSFTSWTQHCGPLLPNQAARVIELVRLHTHGYDVELGLEEYKQLLDIKYNCGKNKRLEKEAADTIRMIKNMMQTRGMLESHDGWNLLFHALSTLNDIGSLITSYNDMQQKAVQPSLSTYHLIIDSLLATCNRKTITGVVFPLWRTIVQDYPQVQPDVELMNKLIKSCRLSQHYERAFFFFTSMKDCNVVPNLATFSELLNACHSERDEEKFQMTVNMAKKILPHHSADIDAIVAEYVSEWEACNDITLAEKIIIQHSSSSEQK